MAAIADYHEMTCVKWVRWSGEEDYVHFVSGNTGCWSSVGRVGGRQVGSSMRTGEHSPGFELARQIQQIQQVHQVQQVAIAFRN